MRMPYGLSSYERAEGNLPELPVINMYAEEAPTEETGVVLQSRPGLYDRSQDMGTSGVDTLFQNDGVLSGALFGIGSGALYGGTGYIGAVTGSGPFSIAGYETRIFTAGGGGLYTWDGATFAAVAVPDSANVIKVVVGASRAIIIPADGEAYYWSDPLTTTIGALSFTSAESQPDRLRDALFIDDVLILFGGTTVEFHPNTGDADLPFQPLEGRVFEVGIRATGCATAFGATFAWVTSKGQICISDPANIITNAGLEAKIAASTNCRLFTFFIEGGEFLALRLDHETQVYSARSRMWSEFASWQQTNWLAQCHAAGVFGSATGGETFTWASDHEEVRSILERRFRAGVVINAGGIPINNIRLRVNAGQTPYVEGDYTDPTIEARISRDGGNTWGEWKPRHLGVMGEYRKRVEWRALGLASAPGFMAEFRVTDPVPLRISDVLVNEPYGGR